MADEVIVNQPATYMPGDRVQFKGQPERGVGTVERYLTPRQLLVKWDSGEETGLLLSNAVKA